MNTTESLKIKEQGASITNALNELEKFALEVELLCSSIKERVPQLFAENASDFKLKDSYEEDGVSNSGWFFEWKNIGFPIVEGKKRKESYYLNYQLSFSDIYVPDETIVENPFPIIQVCFWGVKVTGNNLMCYPIKRAENFDDGENGDFKFLDSDNNCVLAYHYVDDDETFWSYGVELLKVNSTNLEDLLIKPVIELLKTESLALSEHPLLADAILRYPALKDFIVE